MEAQQILNSCLKKPYVDIETSIADLENFYTQLTGYSHPFSVQPDDVAPEQRIHFLCRQISKELDFKVAPFYFQVMMDVFLSCVKRGENMYVDRMIDMFIESLDYLPNDIPIGVLFGGSESLYEKRVIPFVKMFNPQAMPKVTESVRNLGARIQSKELLPDLTDSERAECVNLIQGTFDSMQERANYVQEHSVVKLFQNKPEIVNHIRKSASELTLSPAVGIFKFMDFDDEMDYMNSAVAVFTEEHMAFIPKRMSDGLFKKAGKTFSWRMTSVASLSVGSEHSVVHFGYDSNNWQKIHLTWTFKGGTVITSTICSGMSKDESRTFFNQRINPLLGQLANYFPVTLDGGHIERSSGYRTSIGFGVWF